jgi:hypothetical protein
VFCVGGWWIFSLFLVGLNFKAIKASVHRPFTRDTIVWWLALLPNFHPFFVGFVEFQGRIWEVVSAYESPRRHHVGARLMKAALSINCRRVT